jgi:hypothetical protein
MSRTADPEDEERMKQMHHPTTAKPFFIEQ